MNLKYRVSDKNTGLVLTQSGAWVPANALRCATFNTEEEAQAAFPADMECCAYLAPVREAVGEVCLFIRVGGAYLSRTGEVNVVSALRHEAQPFWTEDEAADRAEELGLDMDHVCLEYGSVHQIQMNEETGLLLHVTARPPAEAIAE